MGFLDSIFHRPKEEVRYRYVERGIRTNLSWVSLEYDGCPAVYVIENLKPGDELTLKWEMKPFRNGEHVRVFAGSRQIGWIYGYPELHEAMIKGWDLKVKVTKNGQVNTTERYVWWCEIEITYQVPYRITGNEVYATRKYYHSREDCGNTGKACIQLSEALERGLVPCPKCVKPKE